MSEEMEVEIEQEEEEEEKKGEEKKSPDLCDTNWRRDVLEACLANPYPNLLAQAPARNIDQLYQAGNKFIGEGKLKKLLLRRSPDAKCQAMLQAMQKSKQPCPMKLEGTQRSRPFVRGQPCRPDVADFKRKFPSVTARLQNFRDKVVRRIPNTYIQGKLWYRVTDTLNKMRDMDATQYCAHLNERLKEANGECTGIRNHLSSVKEWIAWEARLSSQQRRSLNEFKSFLEYFAAGYLYPVLLKKLNLVYAQRIDSLFMFYYVYLFYLNKANSIPGLLQLIANYFFFA
jgi:hypothetical protein